uniref:Bm7123 n=1 Tax=Brugia malayi TaxID=6279 RepID=A0A0H5SA22_BRUMA|nr:Bm7123 [Brugia malayi]
MDLDPWNPEILPYLYPDWDPLKECNVTRVMHTELKNGSIRMLDNTTSKCEYRCLYKDGETNFISGKWTEMEKNVTYYESCDFVETHCTDGNTTTFRYIHVQVIRPTQKIFQKEDNLHPGVFIFILDSTSLSSGIRTMAKTNQVLRQFYEATTFYYHNKIGRNSRQNAYGIFSGTRIFDLNANRFPGKNNSEHPEFCKHGIKINETVTYDFTNQTYASIMAEDWPSEEVWKDFNTHFYKGECQEYYHKIMDFVDKFLDEYKGFSKFVLVWLSRIAHNSASGLYRTDKVAVPQYLRSNEQLILNLKSNSRRHTSQYDIYATLYDIARYAKKKSFQNWDEHDFSEELGKVRGGIRARSLLRPIQYDRTCEEMEIPDQFCICEKQWHTIDIHDENVMKAAQFTVNAINNFLKKKGAGEKCEILHLKEEKILTLIEAFLFKVVSAEYIKEQPLLKVVVSASPSDGRYETQLLKKAESFEIPGKIVRVNSYGSQSHCVDNDDIRPLCYCRQQLKGMNDHFV